jgi:hypothetical protein
MKKFLAAICLLIFAIGISAQTKTITNADLEKYRQERLKAEEDYRKNYKRLGLPSPEEIERQREQQRRENDEAAAQISERKAQTQNDFIARANALKSQIIWVEAQINYLRSQNGNNSSDQTVNFTNYGITFYGGGYQNYGYRQRQTQLPQNLQTVRDISRMYPNSNDVYNRSTGRYEYQNQRPNRYYRGGYVAPVVIYGGNYSNNDFNSQITYLEQQRAGLYAQLNALREEARRAGVRID